jgi:hypothetical protein
MRVSIKLSGFMRSSSPLSISAPAPAAVTALASAVAGFRYSVVRFSPRSFSRAVCVCLFSSVEVAGGFAAAIASGLGFPFCRVRRCLGGWGVSVPVLVRVLRRPRHSVFRLLPVRCPRLGLPTAVLSVLARAGAVGFSGSRSSVPAVCSPVAAAVAPLHCPVFTGCAAGVDAAFRGWFPSASVLAASSFGLGRGSLAARSAACVRAVAVAGAGVEGSFLGGLWVSFPSGECPAGLLPSASSSRTFCGSGSGSWASLAFAWGSGLPCLVFGFAPPASWGFQSLGSGWWFSGYPAASQLSLSF